MEFLLIASAHLMALLSPGPDFFLILQTSLRLPRKYACVLCCGIAAANGVYIAIAVLGLESIRQFGFLLQIMKYLGGAYLVFIGIALLRAPKRGLMVNKTSFLHIRSFGRQFWVGFLSAILNPKNMIFYLSLFTVMVGETTPLVLRFFYGLWMCLTVLCWDLFVAVVIGSSTVKARYENLIFRVEKISGGVLAGFGVVLSFS